MFSLFLRLQEQKWICGLWNVGGLMSDGPCMTLFLFPRSGPARAQAECHAVSCVHRPIRGPGPWRYRPANHVSPTTPHTATWATWAGLPPFVILAEIHISRLFNPLVARLAGPSIHHLQLGCGQMQQQNKMVNTALAALVTLVTRQSHSRTIGHPHIVTWSLWGKNINSCDKRPTIANAICLSLQKYGNARQFCHYQISPWFSKTCLFSISPRAANGGNESRGQFTFLWQQHPAWLRLQFSAIYILPFNIVSIQSSEICTDEVLLTRTMALRPDISFQYSTQSSRSPEHLDQRFHPSGQKVLLFPILWRLNISAITGTRKGSNFIHRHRIKNK